MSAQTELRAWMIAQIKADAACQATALGATPRVFNRVPNEGAASSPAFPFLIVEHTNTRPFETADSFGEEHEVTVFVEGEYFGDLEGEAIFKSTRRLFRDAGPVVLSTNRLVNLEWVNEDVAGAESGKRYYGLQRWRAVTEETS